MKLASFLFASKRDAIPDISKILEASCSTRHSERFCAAASAEVYATLPEEGTDLCSERTTYRLLAARAETRQPRNQLVCPAYVYVNLDSFSRYAGWMVAHQQRAELAAWANWPRTDSGPLRLLRLAVHYRR